MNHHGTVRIAVLPEEPIVTKLIDLARKFAINSRRQILVVSLEPLVVCYVTLVDVSVDIFAALTESDLF